MCDYFMETKTRLKNNYTQFNFLSHTYTYYFQENAINVRKW